MTMTLADITDDLPLDEQVVRLKEYVKRYVAETEARMIRLEQRHELLEEKVRDTERKLERHERRLVMMEAKIDALRRGAPLSILLDDLDDHSTCH